MDGMTEQERAIAWLWAIEALASFKEVDVSLLNDLIKMAPPLPDDAGKNAKERVALRCLEGFFGDCNVMSKNVTSAQNSKVCFDISESCEDVLKRILDETPESELRMAGPGLLKWDIHPFLMHKRASLPKPALKQLKESILNGTHPHAAFLKGKSGLTLRSDGDRVSNPRVNDSFCNARNMGVNRNSDPLTLEKESRLSKEVSDNANVFPPRSDRIASSDAEAVAAENCSSVNNSDHGRITAKKMKRNNVLQSTEHNEVPSRRKELLQDSSEGGRCDSAEVQMRIRAESTVLMDGHDDSTASKNCGQSDGNAILKSQLENHLNVTSMPRDTFWDEAHPYSCADRAKEDGEINPETRTSGHAHPDGTPHKVSSKVFNSNSEYDFQSKEAHYASADGPQEKSIAEDRNDSATEDLADKNSNCATGSDDCCVISKKMKWNASYVLQSIEQNLIPLHGRQLLEDSCKRDVQLSERERCVLEENHIGMMNEDKVVEDVHDDYTASKTSGESNGDTVHKSRSQNHFNPTSIPQYRVQDEDPRYTHGDEAKDDDGLHPEPKASCVFAKVSAEVFNFSGEQGLQIKVPNPASAEEPKQMSIADEGKDDSEQCPEPRTTIAPLDETQYKDSGSESDSSSEHKTLSNVVHPESADGSQKKIITEEAKELMNWLYHYNSETSTDSEGFHDEKIDVAMKKHAFLSSQSTSGHNSSATADSAEKSLCMKCNEGGGQLLICNTSNCPVVVHENCLGSSSSFHEKGNFYCPFCAYSLTLTEYLESKKQTALLKKGVNAFICSLEHQPEGCLGTAHKIQNKCRRNLDGNLNGQSHLNGHLGDRRENLRKQCEVHASDVGDLHFQNTRNNEQEVAPSASRILISAECGEKSGTAGSKKIDVSAGEKEGEENVVQVQECILVGIPLDGRLDGCQNQVPAEGDNLSIKNTGSLLVHHGQLAATGQEDLLQYVANAPEEQGDELSIDPRRDDDQNSSTSNYLLRSRKGP